MKATFVRNRRLYCCGAEMEVLADGIKVAKLKNGETAEVDLPDNGAQIRVCMGNWAGSPTLHIPAGTNSLTIEVGAETWPIFDILSLSYFPWLKNSVLYVRQAARDDDKHE